MTTLTAHADYDVPALRHTGWIGLPGQRDSCDGYHWGHYFDGSTYLGPDQHGIEPTFEPESVRPAAAPAMERSKCAAGCGRTALDGHATCGMVDCREADFR